MPQKAVISEGTNQAKSRLAGVKQARGSETAGGASRMLPLPCNTTRSNLNISSINNMSLICKKKILRDLRSGVNHHPYQSSPAGNNRLDLNIAARDNLSSFTQRVMSAKLLRLKQLQNQLSEAHLQLNELCTENRLLRSLQRRQDLALDRYEGTHAQLPQLVRSHQEEVRVLRTKYKNLKLQYRSVTKTLKEREVELQNLKENHTHLLKLSKDRQLGERESLTKQVTELKSTVDNQTSTIQLLNRRILLETKNLKFQLQQEVMRHKATQSELEQTLLKINQLQGQLEQAKERISLPPSMDRFWKTSSPSKPLGVIRPAKEIGSEKYSAQTARIKRTNKERAMNSANNTNLSSGHPTSSSATIEFSTSLESSPEHKAHEIVAAENLLPSLKQSLIKSQQCLSPENETDLNLHLGSFRDGKPSNNCRSIKIHSLSDKTLEEEFENAVSMLNELSTKHKGSFEDNLSSALTSLDLTSAKHLAALANATFAAKEDSQTFSEAKLLPDEFASSLLECGEDITLNCFNTLSSSQKGKSIKENRTLNFSEYGNTTSKTDDSRLEYNSEAAEVPFEPQDHPKSGNAFLKRTENGSRHILGEEAVNKKDEGIEACHKEALLKALKAIDDKSAKGSDSDESDSPVMKVSTAVLNSQRGSSDIGARGNVTKKRSPFK